jgi:hypothetical protein
MLKNIIFLLLLVGFFEFSSSVEIQGIFDIDGKLVNNIDIKERVSDCSEDLFFTYDNDSQWAFISKEGIIKKESVSTDCVREERVYTISFQNFVLIISRKQDNVSVQFSKSGEVVSTITFNNATIEKFKLLFTDKFAILYLLIGVCLLAVLFTIIWVIVKYWRSIGFCCKMYNKKSIIEPTAKIHRDAELEKVESAENVKVSCNERQNLYPWACILSPPSYENIPYIDSHLCRAIESKANTNLQEINEFENKSQNIALRQPQLSHSNNNVQEINEFDKKNQNIAPPQPQLPRSNNNNHEINFIVEKNKDQTIAPPEPLIVTQNDNVQEINEILSVNTTSPHLQELAARPGAVECPNPECGNRTNSGRLWVNLRAHRCKKPSPASNALAL